MRLVNYDKVENGGFFARIETLNEKVTINSVYDRFYETGRIEAFDFNWHPGEEKQPHYFWDSDVAKWIEGASYILKKHPNRIDLSEKIEILIDKIEKNQQEDGYFNIYFTIVEPELKFKNRGYHELYCAGHLIEAAIAYAEATGKDRFLHLMEKYADCIYKVFLIEKSAAFSTPGHEEIELALVRLYRYTKNKKWLDLAVYFVNTRGTDPREDNDDYNQSHLPVREQTEAVGHSVRAVYLYCAMADVALETGDKELLAACKKISYDIIKRKMYITGGVGSCYIGETFSKPYDLPNDQAYTETCAGIGLMFFMRRMLALENNAMYADVIEKAFYNGVLSGLSLNGKSFFYENPLEITMLDRFSNKWGAKRFPITQRLECFGCSCCPPNINRLLSSLGNYIFGTENDTLFVNQFTSCTLHDNGLHCEMTTDYPSGGEIKISSNAKKLAVRIPYWCENYNIDRDYTIENGYAVVSGGNVKVVFDMTPYAVRANNAVVRDAGKIAIMRGPVVYCAESVDNGDNLHMLAIPYNFTYEEEYSEEYGMKVLTIDGFREKDRCDDLYIRASSKIETFPKKIKMIPYRCFANREECDMLTWFREE